MLEKTKTYLDSSSGAPLHPLVSEALFSFLRGQNSGLIANPASQHSFGRKSNQLLEQTREVVLKSMGLSADVYDVEFTNSGSEANRLAVVTSLQQGKRLSKWLVQSTEHSGTLNLIPEMQAQGIECKIVDSKNEGEAGSLLSAMAINNETGITSHIHSASERHCDYIAGWGKVSLSSLFKETAKKTPEWVTISAYKCGGLSGVGALIKKKGLPPVQRSGTANMLGILSMKVIAENIQTIQSEFESLEVVRNQFESWLQGEIPELRVHGKDQKRAPHISNIGLPLKKKTDLTAILDQEGFAVSSGSACNSGLSKPSHVLLAMGYSEFDAKHSIRISLTRETTSGDLERLGNILKRVTLKEHESKT